VLAFVPGFWMESAGIVRHLFAPPPGGRGIFWEEILLYQ
jgi:hypothetical protein